ncbi:MAG: aldo/keto reductase [Betaproteobacteria bacterium]|nr:MAG: aldo/keto reductase [Betaproteobacteria bacterium]
MARDTDDLRERLARAPFALGGAPLGNLFRAVEDECATALVRHAYAAGIRYFDTAPHYGHGRSERRMGDALRGFPRATYLLSTKVGRLLEARDDAPRDQHGYVDTLPFVQRYDYTADGVRRSLDDSLQRLGLARVDIVYIHDIDRKTHGEAHSQRLVDALDGGLPALAKLKSEGAIVAYGLGVNDVAICCEVLRNADLDVILLAGRYTLADQSALAQLLPECQRRGVAVVLGAPYNSGILATGAAPANGAAPYFNYAPAPPEILRKVADIERVCREFAVPLKAAALQFPRAHPAVASVLAGARSVAEVDENFRMAGATIPREFWNALREKALIAPEAPLSGET